MKVNLSNSIYQRNGSKMGLTVKDGMLINNRPTSISGIQQAAELNKTLKRAEKIQTMSQAVALGNMREDMMEDDCCGS